ncbi:hypothetical protein [Candidatus Berkiella aquae]|uniref:Uncharacterized protein n=1 Tax=Candidatus Berkiella aquae TaxID=295108 RepID=A0A0Q9YKR7_9GAMM|nr:hypothetical protein [Candidatus Berkiella aquae]MCS5711685.1 hypothetical protein [Candidatus Berkiella aquae]
MAIDDDEDWSEDEDENEEEDTLSREEMDKLAKGFVHQYTNEPAAKVKAESPPLQNPLNTLPNETIEFIIDLLKKVNINASFNQDQKLNLGYEATNFVALRMSRVLSEYGIKNKQVLDQEKINALMQNKEMQAALINQINNARKGITNDFDVHTPSPVIKKSEQDSAITLKNPPPLPPPVQPVIQPDDSVLKAILDRRGAIERDDDNEEAREREWQEEELTSNTQKTTQTLPPSSTSNKIDMKKFEASPVAELFKKRVPPEKTATGIPEIPTMPPLPQTPTTKTPVLETPVLETPVLETPVLETPVLETPVLETPVLETPVLETPVPETPVPETPVPETPVPETPVPETVEAQVLNTPETSPLTQDSSITVTSSTPTVDSNKQALQTISEQAHKLESYAGNLEYIKYLNKIFEAKITSITEIKIDKMLGEFIKRTGLNYNSTELKAMLRNDNDEERKKTISKLVEEINDIYVKRADAIYKPIAQIHLDEYNKRCNEISTNVANGTITKNEAIEQIKQERELTLKKHKENDEVKKASIVGTSSLTKMMVQELGALALLNRHLHIQKNKNKSADEKKEVKVTVKKWFTNRQPEVQELGADRAHDIHPQNIHELGLVHPSFIIDLDSAEKKAKDTISKIDILKPTLTTPSYLGTSPSVTQASELSSSASKAPPLPLVSEKEVNETPQSIAESKKPKTSKSIFSRIGNFFASIKNFFTSLIRTEAKQVSSQQPIPQSADVMPPQSSEAVTSLPSTTLERTRQWQPAIKPNAESNVNLFTQTKAEGQTRVQSITHQLQSTIQTPVATASPSSINDLADKLSSANDSELNALGIKNFEMLEPMTPSSPAQIKMNVYCTEDTSVNGKTTEVKAEHKPGTEGVTYMIKKEMNESERQQSIEKICKLAVATAKPGTEFKIPNQDPVRKAATEAALEKALQTQYPESYVKGQLKVPEAPKQEKALRT